MRSTRAPTRWRSNFRIQRLAISAIGTVKAPPSSLPSLDLRGNVEWAERETVGKAIEAAKGVKKDAAELMGISQRALSYYLAKYRVE